MIPTEAVARLILTVREQRVILDSDLATLHGVTTRRLNEQFRRNRKRFPADFAFQLTAEDLADIRSQIATGSLELSGMRSQIATASKRNIRYRPYALPNTARFRPPTSSTVRAPCR